MIKYILGPYDHIRISYFVINNSNSVGDADYLNVLNDVE